MWKDYIKDVFSAWVCEAGKEGDVVLSSRVRLARNLDGFVFPHWAKPEVREKVLQTVMDACRDLIAGKQYRMYIVDQITPLERSLLVEKNLISPQHEETGEYNAVILDQEEKVSVMINEEDHLRIQSILPGLALEEAWRLADNVDNLLEARLTYAFNEDKGYLTCCPTNLGTGMRASIMLHLPALTMVDQAKKILAALSRVNINIRGLFGEGSEPVGNIFQVSNQVALGHSEDEIIRNLQALTSQVIAKERSVRELLMRENKAQLEDRLYRSYGILSNARMISTQEAMRYISDVMLGTSLGIIKETRAVQFKELLLLIRPAFLQKVMDRELDAGEQNIYRAAMLRERMQGGQ
ncbi:MAG: protein arginine kinase [Bacillota bacterium]